MDASAWDEHYAGSPTSRWAPAYDMAAGEGPSRDLARLSRLGGHRRRFLGRGGVAP